MPKPAPRPTPTSIVPPPPPQQPTGCPAGPSKSTKLTFVLEATIRGAEKAPAQFQYRARCTRRTRAWPDGVLFLCLVAAEGHGVSVATRQGGVGAGRVSQFGGA